MQTIWPLPQVLLLPQVGAITARNGFFCVKKDISLIQLGYRAFSEISLLDFGGEGRYKTIFCRYPFKVRNLD